MKACLFFILLLVCIAPSAVFAKNQIDTAATRTSADTATRDITKSATVTTNDPASPILTLRMKGRVDLFARITPSSVKLQGAPGEAVRSVVEVIPGERYPFQIIGEPTVPGKHVGCRLERREGKYLLTIE